MNRAFLLILFIFAGMVAYSQKIQKVSATYTYYAPESMSVEEAKRTAFERAKIQAIADEFGAIVSQSNSTVISNKNGESDTQFFSYGSSDVKGEWIETIGKPSYEIKFDNNLVVVTCHIVGKAREIVPSPVEFTAKTLRNGTDKRFESNEFKDGDDLFLYFKSPVDGNLAVFLLDEKEQTVYSILPYKGENKEASPIIGDKEYIFFSRKEVDKHERPFVDEYVLNCESIKEFNTIYLLFSPSHVGKLNGYDSELDEKPISVSYSEFKKWLSKSLSKDASLQQKQIHISISK